VKEMTELIKMVFNDLKDSGADPETLELWKSIGQWYEEGGPDTVQEGLTKKVKEIGKIARKQLRETKQVMPKKKKTRKKKKKRR